MQRSSVRLVLSVLLLVGIAVVAFDQVSPGRSRAAVHGRSRLAVEINTARPSFYFRPGAVGLSIETSQLARAALRPVGPLVSLMRALGPGTLRIGGSSADHSWWTDSGEPKPAWANSTVTPEELARLDNLLISAGWNAILTVDLGHFEPVRAAEEVSSAARILGPRLRAIEIGNEPNAYATSLEKLRPASYGVGNYISEVNAYRERILEANPSIRFDGPDLSFAPSSHTWLPAIAEVHPSPFAEITDHYYPTAYNQPKGRCPRTEVPPARALLSPLTREYEDNQLGRLIAAGALAHRPTRLSETNTTSSCNSAGGPRTSPVFASALWALDWTLRAAGSGVAGLNFHSKFGRCSPYSSSSICAPRSSASALPTARPEYYGLYAASRLEEGRFVPLKLEGRGVRSTDFTAYATLRRNHTLTVAIVNMAPRGAARVTVTAPRYSAGTVDRLTAPSIHAKGHVTFGGAPVNAEGQLHPRAIPVHREGDTFTLRSHAGSAQIVTLTTVIGAR
jgi:hypothetical protein